MDDLEFGRGEAGPPGGGPFAAAAFACDVGDRVVEGEFLALFPCLGEGVCSKGVPGVAGGGAAVGDESGCQIPQPGPAAFAAPRMAAAARRNSRGGHSHHRT
jgi:hypothetical protein